MSRQKSQANQVGVLTCVDGEICIVATIPSTFRQMHPSVIVSLKRALFNSAVEITSSINQGIGACSASKTDVMNKRATARTGNCNWKRFAEFLNIQVIGVK